MPVTVPASHGDAAHPDAGRRVPPGLLALDEHLFNPDASQWLVIDSGNTAVPRTVVPSLADGLELVGRGRIAALVGHLRDGVGVVDVDVPGPLGDFLAAEVSDWLSRRDCWVLERPSGGAKGRWHIFFAHPDFHYAPAAARSGFAAAVSGYLTALAEDVKVPRNELDLRDAVRPLSSPHRFGAVTRPKGDLREALRGLKRLLPDPPAPSPLRPRVKVKPTNAGHKSAAAAGSGLVVPLALQRWKRQLRTEWRTYLLTGEIPAGSWAAGATKTRTAVEVDRSLVEAACTREMVWAIGDPEMAWRIIRESHPAAMTKAKHQGYSWWLGYVWNELVRSASEFNTTPGKPRKVEAPPAEVLEAVAAARQELDRLKWTVPARQRAALLLVGHQLLDRVLRKGKLRVPCPERDLLLDTGLGDRKTVRAALARLNGRLGTLHTDCLSLTERDSSSYEFEINSAPHGEGRQIPPPVFDPPPTPRGLWLILPRASHSLWRTLLTSPGPLDLADLAVKAGLVEDGADEPSKSQRSTAKAALVALSRAGMVRVDEHGRWQAATRPRSVQIERDAAAAYARQLETIEAERAAYRAGTTSSWTAGRARAIKAQRAKEKVWWDHLSPAAQAARVATRRLEFEQMSISQQAALKARLAERRIRAGLDELETYQTWLRTLPADEYVARSLERKQRFQDLSPAERGASVASWDRHRLRYGLTAQRLATPPLDERPATPDAERAALLPDGAAERDAAFLERQGDLLEQDQHQVAG
ncbi:hypothetical protein BJ993_005058 [Nocardioides aromaticivorans]|uniref:Uncharacterized protein n=1 Tax=Nocardioides aromaticivorans TaxID=200618 RepID=A0A7Z0CRH3_9ACTN|nr:hypothetical protein [Nocardioides aromaticivorans]NYI47912.1 hypothetical protein [Nocardioides aromaticivorans]